MDPMDEGLLLEGDFPVSFQLVENFPKEGQLALINEKNESLLRASLIPHEPVDLDEHDEISLELRRQDLKINMLLDMVGELLAQHNKLPSPVRLNLTSLGLECLSSVDEFKAGEKVAITLYITPPTPRALKLYGEVFASDNDRHTAINFVGVNQSLQDWLEKFIFRQHRRIIAQGLASK